MLLIDEIELALHPIAQVQFYDYLLRESNEKDLVIIISTHSATLIKQARNLQYLEKNNGIINVVDSIYPAYVLKHLSVDTDNRPDYLFFVEDIMAQKYVMAVLDQLKKNGLISSAIYIKVMPVGGYIQVLNLMISFYGVEPFSKGNVHSFLDHDVQDSLRSLEKCGSPAGRQVAKMFHENRDNWNCLSITPELGFWNEIISNVQWFVDAFNDQYGRVSYDLNRKICYIHSVISDINLRKKSQEVYKRTL